jgi:hypothetical protein
VAILDPAGTTVVWANRRSVASSCARAVGSSMLRLLDEWSQAQYATIALDAVAHRAPGGASLSTTASATPSWSPLLVALRRRRSDRRGLARGRIFRSA